MEGKYPSDLTDQQWEILRPWLPPPAGRGRKSPNRRWIINAVLYVLRTACQGRMLPKDFPNWKSVYTVFRRWRKLGVWKQVHGALREEVRRQAGRELIPTAAVIDGQTVKTTEVGGPQRGYDAAKKVYGRKRHIVVDTLGLLLAVVVHSARVQDQEGAKAVFTRLRERHPKLKAVFGDSADVRNGLPQWVGRCPKILLQTVLRPAGFQGITLLPKRWIVERTFGRLRRRRRHSKDYERKPETSETLITISMIALMLRRLAKADNVI